MLCSFCVTPGNDFFVEVPEEFISQEFNWLNISYNRPAIEFILGQPPPVPLSARAKAQLEDTAKLMYGLIHQRFILSEAGLLMMKDKYEAGVFGKCPRVMCEGQPVLPMGLSETPGSGGRVKLFCPQCWEVYHTSRRAHDGAFWGPTFPHLFLLTFPEIVPPPKGQSRFVPRVFGFRLHASSPSMQIHRGIVSPSASSTNK